MVLSSLPYRGLPLNPFPNHTEPQLALVVSNQAPLNISRPIPEMGLKYENWPWDHFILVNKSRKVQRLGLTTKAFKALGLSG